MQADYIYNEIMRLRKLHPKMKVYAVCADMCASAAYYIASAADDIYADPASLVGSIGVMYNGFGFVGTLEKLGIQRRLLTAGDHKDFMDPFSPETKTDHATMEKLLSTIHQQFIDKVKRGRGKRLANNPIIYSGSVWTGTQAKKLGLIDGFGSAGYVAREVIKNDKIRNYTVRSHYIAEISKLLGQTMSTKFIADITGFDRLFS